MKKNGKCLYYFLINVKIYKGLVFDHITRSSVWRQTHQLAPRQCFLPVPYVGTLQCSSLHNPNECPRPDAPPLAACNYSTPTRDSSVMLSVCPSLRVFSRAVRDWYAAPPTCNLQSTRFIMDSFGKRPFVKHFLFQIFVFLPTFDKKGQFVNSNGYGSARIFLKICFLFQEQITTNFNVIDLIVWKTLILGSKFNVVLQI